MFYFINKILLLEQLVLGGKKTVFINFAFFHDFTAFADISVFIKYLFLGADVFPVFIIEHIACGVFFYGFGQQFPFRKNKVDMVIRFSLVMVQCRNTLHTILFFKAVCEKPQQLIRLIKIGE